MDTKSRRNFLKISAAAAVALSSGIGAVGHEKIVGEYLVVLPIGEIVKRGISCAAHGRRGVISMDTSELDAEIEKAKRDILEWGKAFGAQRTQVEMTEGISLRPGGSELRINATYWT